MDYFMGPFENSWKFISIFMASKVTSVTNRTLCNLKSVLALTNALGRNLISVRNHTNPLGRRPISALVLTSHLKCQAILLILLCLAAPFLTAPGCFCLALNLHCCVQTAWVQDITLFSQMYK